MRRNVHVHVGQPPALTDPASGQTIVSGTSEVGVHRYLVVANRTLAGTQLLERLRELTTHGPCAFHVVIPAEPPKSGAWTEAQAHAAAEARLTEALERFSVLDADVDGEVGDANPPQAVEDVIMRGERFDAIVVSTLPHGLSRWLKADLPRRLEGRTGLRVIHVVGHEEPTAAG